jgi:hypothetical protein
MIKIIDDALPQHAQDFTEKYCLSEYVEWRYVHDISGVHSADIQDKNYVASAGFVHAVYSEHVPESPTKVMSRLWHEGLYVEKMIDHLCNSFGVHYERVVRAKLNLTMPVPGYTKDSYCGPHTDFDDPHLVLLYYINDSDGDTIFFEKPDDPFKDQLKIAHRVTPKKGRCVLFDGSIYHTQAHPINTRVRLNLNVNIVEKL